MRFICALALLFSASLALAANEGPPAKAKSFPVALDPNFQFRKVKIFTLSDQVLPNRLGKNATNPDQLSKKANRNSRAAAQDASITFERSYRLFGAVTVYDQHQRYGQYFDFFWRAKEKADVTVRFEYKQEKLRAFTQAKEASYQDIHGTNKTEFRVVGDEFFDDGKVLAWRCLLINHGRIVAEKRSFLWNQ